MEVSIAWIDFSFLLATSKQLAQKQEEAGRRSECPAARARLLKSRQSLFSGTQPPAAVPRLAHPRFGPEPGG